MGNRFNTDDMLDIYLFENQQLLEKLEIMVLEQGAQSVFDEEIINELFRTIHTIKGSSAVMMFDNITKVSHKLEDIFYEIREHRSENVPYLKLVEHVLKVIDFIRDELNKINGGSATEGNLEELIQQLEELLSSIKVDSKDFVKKEADSTPQIYIAPIAGENRRYHSEYKKDELPLFIDLESSVEEIEARAELLQKQKQEKIEKVFIPGDFVVQVEAPTYVHVEIEKLDRLMELVGKLAASNSLDNMKSISRELQKTVVSMRKIPLQGIFQRMYRVVFEVSRKQEKDVDFQMEGENIELDRSIAEHISDPLMHLIRNAIDHGVESVEERVQTKKSRKAILKLSAKIEANTLFVSVEDDGRGMDREIILSKALMKGLIDKKDAANYVTDEDVFGLITLPGFSTREVLTEFSGRGVGMDVVVTSIAAVGGNLKIESERGKGTKMTIVIPLV